MDLRERHQLKDKRGKTVKKVYEKPKNLIRGLQKVDI